MFEKYKNHKLELYVDLPDEGEKLISEFNTIDECLEYIKKELEKMQVEYFYFRLLDNEDSIMVDYGSYFRFYKIKIK